MSKQTPEIFCRSLLFALVLLLGFFVNQSVSVYAGDGKIPAVVVAQISVTPERNFRVSPKLEVDIPGVIFTDQTTGEEINGGQNFSVPFLAQYINGVYRYSIGVGVLIALVLTIIAGFRWMTAAGNAQTISDAKTMITNAILGLALLLGAYTLIGILNPQLLQLKSLNIFAPKQSVFGLAEDYAAASNVGQTLLDGIKKIPSIQKDGKWNPDLAVPADASCAKKSKRLNQEKRDIAYKTQLETGWPAAVMLAQLELEGSTFGVKCKASVFIPTEQKKYNEAAYNAAVSTANCESAENCNAGYTWECTKKDKYMPPKAKRDKPPDGILCGAAEKKSQGYKRVSGIACFKSPPTEGNPFQRLLNFYNNNKCIKGGKADYAANPAGFAVLLQKCGYATGQRYAATLIDKMNNLCLLPTNIPQPNGATPDDQNKAEDS